MAKKNLFGAAKAKAPKVDPKKAKEEVILTCSIFHESLSRLAEVNKQMTELAAEEKILKDDVRTQSIKAFIDLYERKKKYPGSFQVRSTAPKNDPTASLLFLPTDKYIKIDEERAKELEAAYGSEIVEETTVYTMDAGLVEEYGEIISDLIMNSKDIPEDDKDRLISATTSYTIKKGTISELTTTYSDVPLREILEDIKPVYQIKDVKIDK